MCQEVGAPAMCYVEVSQKWLAPSDLGPAVDKTKIPEMSCVNIPEKTFLMFCERSPRVYDSIICQIGLWLNWITQLPLHDCQSYQSTMANSSMGQSPLELKPVSCVVIGEPHGHGHCSGFLLVMLLMVSNAVSASAPLPPHFLRLWLFENQFIMFIDWQFFPWTLL